MKPLLGIIIPTLNEQAHIEATLHAVQPCRAAGHQVIVVDGGSQDETVARATPLADQVLISPRGRAVQMNAGAAACPQCDVLLFLHADTLLPVTALLTQVLPQLVPNSRQWGRFNVRLAGAANLLRLVERLMNWRSCWTGVATGDQAIFMTRYAFECVGGFPAIALMEDIALSKALRRWQRPFCVPTPVITSARRWQQRGVVRTIVLMWGMRLGYFCGVSPARLVRYYR